ncbi:hypothetical protein GCM10027169_30670 [Gordonia jinhuaensis]|uniref:RNA polymerase sigma-70 factor, ECF subfamily n=1 Tax=Gordonia jinhuaensis TaxID=1517702 RepID=A0A916WWH2_9ACTN|nr:RNA polymerase sigma factor [Gordonia jinhuaensis]GGB35288.1 hypothetical protein GCM10011489_24160 [Gordonia jinhuaensis]
MSANRRIDGQNARVGHGDRQRVVVTGSTPGQANPGQSNPGQSNPGQSSLGRRESGECESHGPTDEELARRAGLGDRRAFDELVGRTVPLLLRYARRMLSDPSVADDVVQESLVAVWKGLPRFGFRSSYRTWVFSIAHRKIVDIHHDAARRAEYDAGGESDIAEFVQPGPGPAETAEESSLLAALRTELDNLAPRSRAVWWLREMEGLGHGEIADALGISPGSVRGHLQRARADIARRMEPWRPKAVGERPGSGKVSDEGGDSREEIR